MISRRCAAIAALYCATLAVRAADPIKEPAFADRPLSSWIADLDDADVLTREEAIEVLGRMGSEARSALPRLEKIVAGDVVLARRRAALALWKIDGRVAPARELFQEQLKQSRGLQRLQAVQTLRQLGAPASELAPHLVDLVLDSDYAIANPATVLLQQFGADGVPAVAAALPKARGETRQRLLGFVAGLGPIAKPLVPMVKEMLKENEPRARIAAVRTLWNLNEDRPSLTKLIVDIASATDVSARNEAIQFAIMIHPKPKELEPIYREAMKAATSAWRFQAVQALWELDPKSLKDNLKVLTEAVKDVGRSGNWYAAIQVLGAIGPDAKEALPALIDALGRPEGYNNAYMLAPAIARMGPDAVEPLAKHLSSTDQQLQTAARQALQSIGVEAVPKLTPLLKDKDARVRLEVLTILTSYGSAGKDGVAQLIELVKDSDANMRSRALTLLIQMGPEAAAGAPELVKLLGAAGTNANDLVLVIRSLAQIGAPAAVPELKKLLNHQQANIKTEAAEAMLRIDPETKKDALPLLTDLLRKKQPSLNVSSLFGLLLARGVPAAELVGLFQEYVKAQPGSKQALVAAVNAGAQPMKEAAPLLRDMLKDGNEHVRNEAAFAFARFGDDGKDAVPALRALLARADSGWRDRAVTALITLGPAGKDALPELMGLWRSPANPEHQARVADAILSIDKEKKTTVLEGLRTQAGSATPVHLRLAALRVLARHDAKNPELLKSLLAATRDPSAYYAGMAYEVLGALGAEAKPAAAELRSALKDANVAKRAKAAAALWKIEGKPEEAIPVLTAALSERDLNPPGSYYTGIQRAGAYAAAAALGDIGPAAKDALPALRQAMGLGDAALKQLAVAAIAKIEKK